MEDRVNGIKTEVLFGILIKKSVLLTKSKTDFLVLSKFMHGGGSTTKYN